MQAPSLILWTGMHHASGAPVARDQRCVGQHIPSVGEWQLTPHRPGVPCVTYVVGVAAISSEFTPTALPWLRHSRGVTHHEFKKRAAQHRSIG